jgi:hypothetical protein
MEKAMLMSGKTWDRDNLGSLNVTIHEARRLVAADVCLPDRIVLLPAVPHACIGTDEWCFS